MCGRFMLKDNIDNILKQYRIVKSELDNYKKGDIYPSESSPILTYDKGRILKSAKWGFPLNEEGKLVINARSESIDNKSMFKYAFENSRCIILANLFYEWKDEGDKKKTKYMIGNKEDGLISFGGICKFTLNNKGQKELSFVIITTQSNNHMESIHNRMPLMIKDDVLDCWLDTKTEKTVIENIIKSNLGKRLIIEKDSQAKTFEQLKLF